jgi:hypothetical protein
MIKREVVVVSVVYNDNELASVEEAIDSKFFNTDGIISWETRQKSITEVSADITEEDMK